MERTTWLTEQRSGVSATGASATGSSTVGYSTVAKRSLGASLIKRPVGFGPFAYGPGLVCGDVTVGSPTNDHADMGRIAWHGRPLGSPGAGNG